MTEQQLDFIVKRFRSIDVQKIVIDASKQDKQSIIDLQEEQLSDGLASQGDEINPPYAQETIRRKKEAGMRWDVVTLQQKGDFRRKEFVKFSRDGFEISSRDKKTAALVDKYHGIRGGDVFGLSPDSKDIFTEIIKPTIQDLFRDKLLR